MSTKPSKTRTATPAPRIALHLRSREDFTQAIDITGKLQLELAQAEAVRDTEVAAVKARHASEIERIKAQITLHLDAAADYGTAFPAEVFPAGLRSGETDPCTYGIRTDPPSIKLSGKKITEEDAILLLKELGLHDCIRTKEELNKEALVEQDEMALTRCGLKKIQADRFFVKSKEPSATRSTTAA